MAEKFIIVDSGGKAVLVTAARVEAEISARLASGQKFEVYRAQPMKVSFKLEPTDGARRGRGRPAGGRPRKKTGGKIGRPRTNLGPCSLDGCDSPAQTRGLCSSHYQQHRRMVRAGKSGLAATGAKPASKRRKRTRRGGSKGK